MRKYYLGILVIGTVMVGAWRQQPAESPQGKMMIRPAIKSNLLDGPLEGKSKWDKNGYMLHFRQASDEQPLLRVYNPQGQLVSRLYPLSVNAHDIVRTFFVQS